MHLENKVFSFNSELQQFNKQVQTTKKRSTK